MATNGLEYKKLVYEAFEIPENCVFNLYFKNADLDKLYLEGNLKDFLDVILDTIGNCPLKDHLIVLYNSID